jgi:hypothetical protein
MGPYDDMLIRVQSDWNGWRSATIRLGDLEDVHWFQPARAPRALLHGYVSCVRLAAEKSLHDCDGASAPHRLLVCVLKRHTMPAAYLVLTRHADKRPLCALETRAVAGVCGRSTGVAGGGR